MRVLMNMVMGVLLVCLAAGAAWAWDYSVADLGMPDGYSSVKGFDINDNGFVVGKAGNGAVSDAFLWDSSTRDFTILSSLGGNSSAWSINNGNAIVGSSNSLGALWTNAGSGVQNLGTFGGPTSTAFKINDNGQVAGWADLPANYYLGSSVYHGFVTNNNGKQDIGTFADQYSYYDYGWSVAWGLNSHGQATGTAMENDFSYSAFLRNADGSMVNLGKDPAHPGDQANAVVINDLGLIGGNSVDPNNNSHPLVWAPGSTSAAAITMPGAFPYGELYGINERGEMVGVMWNDAGTEHAFMYDAKNGTVSDLNDLIHGGSGWELQYARGINEKGQIVGFGLLNGQTKGFVLNATPEPISSALFFLGSGALGLRMFRRKKKS